MGSVLVCTSGELVGVNVMLVCVAVLVLFLAFLQVHVYSSEGW